MCGTGTRRCGCVALVQDAVDVWHWYKTLWMCGTGTRRCGCVALVQDAVDVWHWYKTLWMCGTVTRRCGCVALVQDAEGVWHWYKTSANAHTLSVTLPVCLHNTEAISNHNNKLHRFKCDVP
eukprot:363513-Chlamydomonas_euryale.AAC.6